MGLFFTDSDLYYVPTRRVPQVCHNPQSPSPNFWGWVPCGLITFQRPPYLNVTMLVVQFEIWTGDTNIRRLLGTYVTVGECVYVVPSSLLKHCLLLPWLHCVTQSLSIAWWLRVCFPSPSFSQLHSSFSLMIAYWMWKPGMNIHIDARSCDLSPERIYFGVCLGSKLNIELIQT